MAESARTAFPVTLAGATLREVLTDRDIRYREYIYVGRYNDGRTYQVNVPYEMTDDIELMNFSLNALILDYYASCDSPYTSIALDYDTETIEVNLEGRREPHTRLIKTPYIIAPARSRRARPIWPPEMVGKLTASDEPTEPALSQRRVNRREGPSVELPDRKRTRKVKLQPIAND